MQRLTACKDTERASLNSPSWLMYLCACVKVMWMRGWMGWISRPLLVACIPTQTALSPKTWSEDFGGAVEKDWVCYYPWEETTIKRMTYFKQGCCEYWLRQAIQTKSNKQQQTFDILCLENVFGKFIVVYEVNACDKLCKRDCTHSRTRYKTVIFVPYLHLKGTYL